MNETRTTNLKSSPYWIPKVVAFCLLALPLAAQTRLDVSVKMEGSGYGYYFGRCVAVIGDANADGYSDVLVGSDAYVDGYAQLRSGADGSILFQSYSYLPGYETGAAVSRTGDVNGDGLVDFAIAFTEYNSGAGLVGIMNGDLSGNYLYQLYGAAAGDGFGTSLACLGDVNGDGVEDLVIAAPYRDVTFSNSGTITIVSGQTGTDLFSIHGDMASEFLGETIANAGDVNADGVDDLIVGLPRNSQNGSSAGSCRVYSGADASLIYTKFGLSAGDRFGYSVDGAGDANGDGFDDFTVGARRSNAEAGSVTLFSGFDGSVLWTVVGAANNRLGTCVAGAGDINGDGFDDVAATAPNLYSTGIEGEVRVFSGVDGSLLHELLINGAYGAVGVSLDSGDIDGDGKNEIITGATFSGSATEGAVYVASVPKFAGTNDDFALRTGINAQPSGYDSKAATGGDLLNLDVISPFGGYDQTVPMVVAQLFTNGLPIAQPAGYPEVWVNPSPFAEFPLVVLYNGNDVPFGPATLPAGGLSFSLTIPSLGAGYSIMLQALALAPSQETSNPFFAATTAHRIELF